MPPSTPFPPPSTIGWPTSAGSSFAWGEWYTGGQKGVDSRIVRDLIVLPRNGAVGTVYLLGGDEDVREGVVEAQELGVAVVLLGIETPAGTRTQARTLVREADDHLLLTRAECLRFLSDARPLRGNAPPAALPAAPARAPITRADAERCGEGFAADWKSKNDAAALATLVAGKPAIPISIDGPLLRSATARLGGTLRDRDRRAVRAGFWKEIETR